jgi:hypothetical protein
MARRVELGAGLAAAVLSLIALAVLLLTPLVPTCAGTIATGRCASGLRYVTLPAAGARVDASIWYYIGAMTVVMLGGAAGAVLDSMRQRRTGLILVWIAAAVACTGCASVAALGSALGIFFLAPVVALVVAAAAASRRRAAPSAPAPGAPTREADPSRDSLRS